MAKNGLIRLPYYPQLNCLSSIDAHAPAVMSVLLFWMTRAKEATYCPKRHHYQMAMHLGMDREQYAKCFEKLNDKGIFTAHEFEIQPKEKTPESKVTYETRYALDLYALQALLENLGTSLSIKLLKSAADDSFDFYDVIEEKFLPKTQTLLGYLSGSDFEAASLLLSRFAVFVNEYCDDFAFKAIAPGWKLLLQVPMDTPWDEYAKELNVRFLRPGERAFDFNFTDGNFFLPDYAEHQATQHITKHFGAKAEPRTLASAMMLLAQASFPDKLTYISELSVADLKPAIELLCQYDRTVAASLALKDDYYHARQLPQAQLEQEQQLFAKQLSTALASITELTALEAQTAAEAAAADSAATAANRAANVPEA